MSHRYSNFHIEVYLILWKRERRRTKSASIKRDVASVWSMVHEGGYGGSGVNGRVGGVFTGYDNIGTGGRIAGVGTLLWFLFINCEVHRNYQTRNNEYVITV